MTDLAQLVEALASLARVGPGSATLIGVGWATVDAERTLDELGGLPVGPELHEPSLGARARVTWLGGTAIVVLEPSTEGRLDSRPGADSWSVAGAVHGGAAGGGTGETGRGDRLPLPGRRATDR